MTFKKLLATAASAALLTGAANAATAALGDTGATGVQSSLCVASETNIAANNTALLEVQITTGGAGEFATANGSHTLTVNLTGATLNGALKAASGAADANEVDDILTPAGGATLVLANQAVGTGGTDGSSSFTITFDVTTQNAASDVINLTVPVKVSQKTAAVSVSPSITIGSGVVLLPGSAKTAIKFYDAYTLTAAADTTDSQIDSADTKKFKTSTGAAAPFVNDTITGVDVGSYKVTRNADIVAANGCTGDAIYASIADAGAGTAFTDTDLEVDLTLTAAAAQAATTTVLAGGNAGTFGVAVTDGSITSSTVETLRVVTTGAAALVPTAVSLAATLDFDSTSLVDESVTATLDELNLSGVTTGTFAWVGDSSKTRDNVFRCTGDLAAVSAVNSTMSNSSAGLAGATESLTVPAATDVQYIINGGALTTAHGSFGIADFSFEFVGASGVGCDRLMKSPADGIVTSFNGNN